MTPSLPPSEEASRLRQEVIDWFVHRRRPDWNARDERIFQNWIDADPRHADAYRQWESRWQAFDAIAPETVAAWREGFAGNRVATASAPTRRGFLKPAFALAAAGVVAGGSYLGWSHLQAQPVFVQAFATQRGQQLEVPLPDGTVLRLDTTTRLEVRYFRQRREVRLIDGQAVFLVQSDAQRPFDVLAGPLQVRVVGTRFAVRYTPAVVGAEGARVSVEQGRVRVTRRDVAPGGGWVEPVSDAVPQGAVFLTAGQQVQSDVQGVLAAVSAVPGDGIAPWREHRLSFLDIPLARALAELERYGSTGLVVRDPAVAALRLSGTFDPRDARMLRRMLPSALPVRLKGDGPVVEIVAAP
ncbi:FecR domain-containing protein [Variovorax sp. ZS18.2.2]|uniref:FecR family protein n=1 Tax=Variovorax sp. ZS18.2.2 TaxID=2971255 RepID=UPI002150D565|nr:FecR domain-containing protein [Variovorax sp. ZS18.2.2]MCR6475922.1 FecR domain-containing protein [Variovorax sp. ZS18.2.2]